MALCTFRQYFANTVLRVRFDFILKNFFQENYVVLISKVLFLTSVFILSCFQPNATSFLFIFKRLYLSRNFDGLWKNIRKDFSQLSLLGVQVDGNLVARYLLPIAKNF